MPPRAGGLPCNTGRGSSPGALQTECREKWENLVKGGDAQYKNARGETKKLDEDLMGRLGALMAKHMTAAQHKARQQRAQARANAGAGGQGAAAGAAEATRKENCTWKVEEVGAAAAATPSTSCTNCNHRTAPGHAGEGNLLFCMANRTAEAFAGGDAAWW